MSPEWVLLKYKLNLVRPLITPFFPECRPIAVVALDSKCGKSLPGYKSYILNGHSNTFKCNTLRECKPFECRIHRPTFILANITYVANAGRGICQWLIKEGMGTLAFPFFLKI